MDSIITSPKRSIIGYFNKQVSEHGNNVALITPQETISYQQLASRVTLLARHLQERGVKAEQFVTIALERSIEFVVSCLAVLKAGGAYIPLNTDDDMSHIRSIVKDSGSKVLLTRGTGYEQLNDGSLTVMDLDALHEACCHASFSKPAYHPVAYAIYTSGSTGQPKGVNSTQEALLNRLEWVWQQYSFSRDDVCCLKAPVHFVDSIGEIFLPLLQGVPLAIVPPKLELEPELFLEFLATQRITRLVLVPSQLQVILDYSPCLKDRLPALKHLEISGEGLSTKLALRIQQALPQTTLINRYGSSEYTSCIFHEIGTIDTRETMIPVGKPIHNTRVYILDSDMKPVNPGERGILWLSGKGLSPGYLNNDRLTRQKFKPNPFYEEHQESLWYSRIYNTGDLVRLNENKALIHLGRADTQVSIYGNRIELSSIEALLNNHPGVKQAVVVLNKHNDIEHLKAYVCFEDNIADFVQLREHLARSLPQYQIPSIFKAVKAFKRLANGKIDRRALQSMDRVVEEATVAEGNPITDYLISACQSLLPIGKIARNHTFFELGLNSLMLMTLVTMIQKHFGIHCQFSDLSRKNTVGRLSRFIAERLAKQEKIPSAHAVTLQNGKPTIAQMRFWLLENRINGDESPNHIAITLRINGLPDLARLQRCLTAIINDNPALSTNFKYLDNQLKAIAHTLDWHLDVISCDETRLGALLENHIKKRFKLENDYLLRGCLFEIEQDYSVLSIVAHHIIFDGWSQQQFLRLLFNRYNGAEDLAQVPYVEDKKLWPPDTSQLSRFQENLAKISSVHLPVELQKPAVTSVSQYRFKIPADKVIAIGDLAKKNHSTVYLSLLSMFAVFLGRYTQNRDVSLGTVISLRDSNEMGCLINTLPMHIHLAFEQDFATLLADVQARFFDFYPVIEYALDPDSGLSQQQLKAESELNVFFIFEKIHDHQDGDLGGFGCELLYPDQSAPKSSLGLYIEEHQHELNGIFKFDPTLFRTTTIQRIANNFLTLIDSILCARALPLYRHRILQTDDYHKLLYQWNDTSVPKKYKTLSRLLYEIAGQRPSDTAVIDHDGSTYDYAWILQNAETMAGAFIQKKHTPGSVIAVAVDPGIDMIVALFAILKSGSAFVPLDPRHPEKRLQHIITDSKAGILVTEEKYYTFFKKKAARDVQVCTVDVLRNHPHPATTIDHAAIDDTACIIYTSGSTGRPKGVKISHYSICNRLSWMWDAFPFTATDKCSQKTALSFVDSLWEIFGPILGGVPLSIMSQQQRDSIEKTVTKLIRDQSTRLVITPSLLKVILDYLSVNELKLESLRMCVISGENASGTLIPSIKAHLPNARLLNLYGSTEVTADASFYEVSDKDCDASSIPVGRPLDNMQMFVLDEYWQPLPIGVIGELFIAGDGVAGGYLDDALSADKFITREIEPGKPRRLFKTGDLAAWQEDGNVILAGRNDNQIKINGMRIDCHEVEYYLQKHHACVQAIVLPWHQPGFAVLIAFILSPDRHLEPDELRDYLGLHLQDAFIPSYFYVLQSFPETITGKIDRTALLSHHERHISTPQNKPQAIGEMEQLILNFFKDSLPDKNIDVNASFFEHGGSSLSAMALAHRVKSFFDIDVGLSDLFDNASARKFARFISHAKTSTVDMPELLHTQRKGNQFPASGGQRAIWFAANANLDTPWLFNVPFVISLSGKLNIKALETAINRIISENDCYQVNFSLQQGKLYQIISHNHLIIKHIRASSKSELNQQLIEHAKHTFSLEQGLLIAVTLFQLNASRFELLVNHHHIITDACSIGKFLEKLGRYYNLAANDSCEYEHKKTRRIDYIDFSQWHNRLHEEGVFQEQLDYWRTQLTINAASSLRPDRFDNHSVSSHEGARYHQSLSLKNTRALTALAHDNHATPSLVLLTVFKLVLSRFCNSRTVLLGMPAAHRHWPELTDMLGYCINTLPVLTQFNNASHFSEAIAIVKKSMFEALKHQDISLGFVQETLGISSPYKIGFDFNSDNQNYHLDAQDLESKIRYLYLDTAQYDLTLFVNKTDSGLDYSFEYKTALYSEAFIHQLARYFNDLIQHVLRHGSSSPVLHYLPADEEKLLLQQGSIKGKHYPTTGRFFNDFIQVARQYPERIAIHSGQRDLTYAGLMKAIDEIAHRLCAQLPLASTKKQPVIATCLPQNTDWLTAILAIWKIGACYLPLNATFPTKRIAAMNQTVLPDLIITDSQLLNKHHEAFGDSPALVIDKAKEANQSALWNFASGKKKKPYAYIIFTSGTTGTPKAVPVFEEAFLNTAYAQIEAFRVNDQSRILQFANCSFDASLSEIATALLCGASLCVIPDPLRKDADALLDYINREGIDIATIPPVMLSMMPKDKSLGLKTLVVAGESCPADVFYHWSRERHFINAYGPTEVTICASLKEVDSQTLPSCIGKPLNRIQLYVLDSSQNLVPRGAEGELYIGGPQLADGYLSQGEDNRHFCSVQIAGIKKKLYRSGDYVRWLMNGDLEFIGRVDRQMSYHGVRIEPREIEQRLEELSFVRQCVVSLEGNEHLVAFIEPDKPATGQHDELEFWPSVAEFFIYDEFLYSVMTNDLKRNYFYQNALNDLAKDKLVLDIGTGKDAILARLALDAGAKKVYAIEYLQETYQAAKRTLENLNLTNRIILIHGDSRQVSLPEPVDIIVSEIVGAIGGSEGAAVILDDAKKRHLKPGGVLIPDKAITKIAAVSLPDEFLNNPGFAPLAADYADKIINDHNVGFMPRICIKNIRPQHLISEATTFELLAFNQDPASSGTHQAAIRVTRDAPFSGFIAWLNLYDHNNGSIDILQDTHCWLPVYFPAFEDNLILRKQDLIDIRCEYRLCDNGLNPDYRIHAVIWRNHRKISTYSYDSLHFHPADSAHPFYKKLFVDNQAIISKALSATQYQSLIKHQLVLHFPDFMRPRHTILLDRFPLNASGKIDRHQLSKIFAEKCRDSRDYEAPVTALERQLQEVWSRLLSQKDIGRNVSFFHLGGDSITAISLVSELQGSGMNLSVRDLYAYPSIATLALKIEETSRHTKPGSGNVSAMYTSPESGLYPLNPLQQDMLTAYRWYPDSDLYINQVYWLTTIEDMDSYQQAWQILIAETECLRLSYVWDEQGICGQIINSAPMLNWDIADWSNLSEEKQQSRLKSCLAKDRKQGFDLALPAPMRVRCFLLGGQRAYVLWTHHHIILDGWSLPLLLKRLDEIYHDRLFSFERQRTSGPQFSRYLEWLRARDRDAAVTFWKSQLGEISRATPLHFCRQSLSGYDITSSQSILSTRLPDVKTHEIEFFAKTHGITINTILQMAWAITLMYYSDEDVVMFGTTVSGRDIDLHQAAEIPGMMIGTVPILANTANYPSLLDGLYHLQKTIHNAQTHAHIGLGDIKRAIGWADSSPLFHSLFVFENYPSGINHGFHVDEKTNFPLVISLIHQDCLQVELTYADNYFAPAMMNRLLARYCKTLGLITRSPNNSINELTLITDEEIALLKRWNTTRVKTPDTTIPHLFETACHHHPNRIALEHGELSLTYEVFNQRSDALCRRLGHQYKTIFGSSFTPETIIAVYLDRGVDLFISILAILKAGGCYLPLDKNYPRSRNEFIIKDSAPAFIMTNQALAPDVSEHTLLLVDLETDTEDASVKPPVITTNNLAYIIYTSGSTGTPNGVMIEHKGVVNLALNTAKALKVDSNSRLLQLNSPCFDTSVQEWSLALLNGATLVIPTKDEMPPSKKIGELILEKFITHLNAPPYVISSTDYQRYPSLKVIISGGDICHPSLVDKWAGDYYFVNDYGPTETTICVSMTRCLPGKKPTIGSPHPNTRFYVLNTRGQLAPIGTIGELYIAGVGMARGYLNRPHLNESRFLTNTFEDTDVNADYKTLYRTGDLVRWTDEGKLEYIGRIDSQLKIRGYRIEPVEIENCLLTHKNIKNCVVIADGKESQRLSIFIERLDSNASTIEECRRYMQNRLPTFMLPNHFVMVDELPLLPNAKIDRKALFKQLNNIVPVDSHERTLNQEQKALMDAFTQALNYKEITLDSHFYTIGGDSINAIQVSAIMQQKGYHLTPNMLYEFPTIKALAQQLEKHKNSKALARIPQGNIELSPIQHWFFGRELANQHHYNQAVMLEYDGTFQKDCVLKTIKALEERYDSLRLRFKRCRNRWTQYYHQDVSGLSTIAFHDLSDVSPEEQAKTIDKISTRSHTMLNIEHGPMMSVLCFTGLHTSRDQLFWSCHHLLCDTVTWHLLLNDFKKIYLALSQGKTTANYPNRSSYADWVNALKKYARENACPNQMPYWLEVVKSIQPIAYDYNACEFYQSDSRSLVTSLSHQETRELLTCANQYLGTRPQELIITALRLAVYQWRGLDELSITMEGHGREPICDTIDIHNIAGWFTTLFPVHFKQSPTQSALPLILDTKNHLRRIPDKGLGYGALLYLLPDNQTKKLRQANMPNLSFNYMGVMDNQVHQDQFKIIETKSDDWVACENRSDYPLAINCYVINNQFKLQLGYSSKHFKKASIQTLLKKMAQGLKDVLSCAREQYKVVHAASDFPLLTLSQATVNVLSQDSEIESIYPLTPLQQGLYFHSRANVDPYVSQLCWQVRKGISLNLLKNAWAALVKNNPVLRTAFHQLSDGQLIQVVHRFKELHWQVLDWSNLDENSYQYKLTELLTQDKGNGFDLTKAGCMRFFIIKARDGKHLCIWSHHHIILDGWSVGLLLQQLDDCYQTLAPGKSLHAARPQPVRFEDYVAWYINQPRQQALNYWKNLLKGYQEPATLLIHRYLGKAPITSHRALQFSQQITHACQAFCKQTTITMNTLLHSALGLILAKYSRRKDIVFGMTISGRTIELQGAETITGLLINSIPVRMRLTDDVSVTDVIHSLHRQIHESQKYACIGLTDIQHAINWQSEKPIFNYLSVLENYPHHESHLFEHCTVKEETHYPLSFVFEDQNDLKVTAIFDEHCFSGSLIESMLTHLQCCLMEMTRKPDAAIATIDILPRNERDKILHTFNQPIHDKIANEANIISTFERISKKYPHNLALCHQQTSLTYAQLSEQITRFSNYTLYCLQESGVVIDSGSPVPLLLNKGIQQIIAIFAVLKLGCAYVPVDPDLPQARINTILSDINSKLLIHDEANAQKASVTAKGCCINIDKEWHVSTRHNLKLRPLTKNNLAYIIFTSGTTGKPKGIMIEHRSVLNYVEWMANALSLNASDRFMQFANYGFDASVWEIFVPLLTGARLFIPGEKELQDFRSLVAWMKIKDITIAQFVPSLFPVFLEIKEFSNLVNLRYLCAGGEKLSYDAVKSILKKLDLEIINLYGPTEVTIDATYKRINRDNFLELDHIPIGKPLANYQVIILDQYHQLCPPGVPGELCVSGLGLARGYYRQEQLTNNVFISNPYSGNTTGSGTRLYKTGDLASWSADGDIYYSGREDSQVKLRGYRIELDEIKERILEIRQIRQAEVLCMDKPDQSLVAFCSVRAYGAEDGLSTETLVQQHLATSLPSYMIPTKVIEIEHFPLNANDKIDYTKLKALYQSSSGVPQHSLRIHDQFIAENLSLIWKRIFNVDEISPDSHFYHLGGHSLKAMQLVLGIEEQLGIFCHTSMILQNPKFIDLVAAVSAGKLLPGKTLNFNALNGNTSELSSEQKRIWFLSNISDNISRSYNMILSYQIIGELDIGRLEHAFRRLINNHPILRARFSQIDGKIVQHSTQDIEPLLNVMPVKDAGEVDRQIQKIINHPFDLTSRCWNVLLLKRTKKDHIMIITIHHILGDGWSLKLMMDDIACYYNKQQVDIAGNPYHYGHYIAWQKQFLESAEAKKQRQYWLEKLKNYERLSLPYDKDSPDFTEFSCNTFHFYLGNKRLKALHKLAEQEQCTPFMVVYGLLNILLYKITQQVDIVIGLPITQRVIPDTDKIIGCLLNTLVLRNQFSADDRFCDFLGTSRKVCLEAYENQLFPFEKVVTDVEHDRDPLRNPIFQVILNWFSDDEVATLSLDGLDVKPYKIAHPYAKFDISFSFTHKEDRLGVTMDYNRSLFSYDFMREVKRSLLNIIDSALSNPDIRLADIPLLKDSQQSSLLPLHATAPEFTLPAGDLFDVFQHQALKYPDKIAVVHNTASITYAELHEKSLALSANITNHGKIIAIVLERGTTLINALLAVLASDNAFVIIDPHQMPVARIDKIVRQCDINTIITSTEHLARLSSLKADPCRLINIDTCKTSDAPPPARGRPQSLSCEKMAYVISTSGTTSEPKMIAISHKNLLNHLLWRQTVFHLSARDVVLQKTSATFDASIWEFFLPLFLGAKCVIADEQHMLQFETLFDIIEDNAVTIAQFSPSVLELLLQSPHAKRLNGLTHLCIGGEVFTRRLHAKCRAVYHGNLYNLYGPAETTIDASYQIVDTKKQNRDIPIGKAISNVALYIVDSNRKLLPKGYIGELAISGCAVGLGYVNDPKLSNEKFIDNPFYQSGQPEIFSRLYLSGDLARMNKDGTIQFIGRRDRQIKFHGIRIDLTQIEYYLTQHPTVCEARVILFKQENSSHLAAFLMGYDGNMPAYDYWQRYLTNYLPAYMCPAYFLTIDEIPLTSNGKTDEHALRQRISQYLSEKTPRQDQQEQENESVLQLRKIWQETLNHAQFGNEDNFFHVGGDSILSVQLVDRINQIFGTAFSITWTFTYNTIFRQAASIPLERHRSYMPVVRLNEIHGNKKLFFIHSGVGGAEVYVNLAKYLDSFEAYGIEPYNFYHSEAMIEDIGELADYYLGLIKKCQPSGPYQLAGWSLGGLLAFEVAYRLQKLGDEVEQVFLLDSFHYDKSSLQQITRFYSENQSNNNLLSELLHESRLPDKYRQRLATLMLNNCKMLHGYTPGKISARVVLFKAMHNEYFDAGLYPQKYIDAIMNLYAKPDNGWHQKARHLDIHQLECTHKTMINKEHARNIARLIDATNQSTLAARIR
ncbi:non-ribosomal peptide synthetase [Legionella spiritensis]|uniref:Non-ribosomal peptide synthase n=1 Tax=Legionella spiritensis TaxID=452 RepID=A0A0W0YZ13_LEGSP|nr:non-ribosomal peptide synthetase [Legionella spiritensis]KTD62092.1 non-ribosomal peptide synthase [Legionella spiritensis]SNV35681.1 non-ribosomal peptide synthase [Legionella spiritensis]